MASPFPDNVSQGNYLFPSEIFDSHLIDNLDVTKPEFKDFLNKLVRFLQDVTVIMNQKDTGEYSLVEDVNNQLFFADPTLSSTTAQSPQPRNVFRKVVNFGTLATGSANHGITVNSDLTFTRMYGCASKPGTNFVAIPNQDIKLTADATKVYITLSGTYTGYTKTYIILEYIKN